MKNIYFIFLLIWSLCAFTACSDDDNDIVMSKLPVTDLKIPATIKQGEILIIEGKGFNEKSQIYLKSVYPLKVEATVSGNSSLSISIPEDFETGVYFIILQQGDLWEIGRVRVIASQESPISELIIPDREFMAGEKLTIEGKGFSEDCQISLLTSVNETYLDIIERTGSGITVQLSKMQKAGNYILLLRQGEQWKLGNIQINANVQTDFRIKQIIKNSSETTAFAYNDEGKVESIMITGGYTEYHYKFKYSEGTIAVKTNIRYDGESWSEDEFSSWTYMLENDQVTSYSNSDGTYNWYYTEDNRLNEISGEHSTTVYTYDNGNLVSYRSWNTYNFSYTEEIPNYAGEVNVMSLVIFSLSYNYQEYFAGLLNLNGQSSTLLPNSITTPEGVRECSYQTMDNGYITKLTSGSDTFEIKYE